jgi:transposase
MVVVVDNVDEPEIKFETGKTAGFDFGLKTFLTCSEGFKIDAPEFHSTPSAKPANSILRNRKVLTKENKLDSTLPASTKMFLTVDVIGFGSWRTI